MLRPASQTGFSKVLESLYRYRRLRNLILRVVLRLEGGDMTSLTLRDIFRKYYNIEIGLYTYGGCFNFARVASGTKIGKFCSFAPDIYIYAANHKMNTVTTHPYLYNPAIGVVPSDRRELNHVVIGNDVWVGQNVIITASVSYIGDGAVIGAGAVVTKDVLPYAVVVGVPATILKFRFDDEQIKVLQELKWWDWDPQYISVNWQAFESVSAFLDLAISHKMVI